MYISVREKGGHVEINYERYSMEIQWVVPRKAYRAIVPELPGCKAYGKTYLKAALNLREAIKVWIEEKQAAGESIPEPQLLVYTPVTDEEWDEKWEKPEREAMARSQTAQESKQAEQA